MSFELYLKSTIDRLAYEIASDLGVSLRADLDDTVNLHAVIASEDAAIVWQLLTLDPAPRDPLYLVQFGLGAKTVADPGNYEMMGLCAAMQDRFEVGSSIRIRDYSVENAGVGDHGFIYVAEAGLAPQEFDEASGIRLYAISGRAVRHP